MDNIISNKKTDYLKVLVDSHNNEEMPPVVLEERRFGIEWKSKSFVPSRYLAP